MTFTNPQFQGNTRLMRAAENAPAMRRGEGDEEAVRILQQALIAVEAGTLRRSIRSDGTLDGDYGGETVRAVQKFQEVQSIAGRNGRGDGIAGRDTWAKLDQCAPRHPVTLNLTPNGPAVTPPAETATTVEQRNGTIGMPTATALRREYGKFVECGGKPCGQNIVHQCAVRMSVALGRCGIGFHMHESDARFTHKATNRHCGGTGVAHNASSSRLFRYLSRIWNFENYSIRGHNAKTPDEIYAAIGTRKGIIYWENCFSGGEGVGGDHIDYWDGEMMMNDRLNYNAPGEVDARGINSPGRFFYSMSPGCYFLPTPG